MCDSYLFTDGNYMKADYNILETLMLKLFDWDLTIPTVATFALYYVEFVVDESDFDDRCAEKMFHNFHDFQHDIKSRVMKLVDQTIYGMTIVVVVVFDILRCTETFSLYLFRRHSIYT